MFVGKTGCLMRAEVHAEDTVSIGSDPQIVSIDAKGMDVEA